MRARPDAQLDIVYGERPRARLDYFPSGTMLPALFLFIHGGYWQRNEKEMFAFVAEGPLRHGIDVAVVGYTLAPDASLTEIVGEIHQALDYLCAHADDAWFRLRAAVRRRLVGRRASDGGGGRASGLRRRPADQRDFRSRADRAQLSQREASS